MRHTITVRLQRDLASWLEDTAKRTGRSRGQIVREQLAKAKADKSARAFLRWAGSIAGPPDLSQRKGFSRK
jgi:predicted transcriptional regulator